MMKYDQYETNVKVLLNGEIWCGNCKIWVDDLEAYNVRVTKTNKTKK